MIQFVGDYLDNIPDFGKLVHFDPLRKPDFPKFRLWTDTVPLADTNCYLFRPLYFETRQGIVQPYNYLARQKCRLLYSLCSSSGIVPPPLFEDNTTNNILSV